MKRTTKQQAELQKIQPKAPKSLSVLTSRVETCLCEMPIIGVWCRPGEIDIPLFLMKRAANMAESSTDAKLEPASSIPKRLPDGASIIFDSEGRMYYEGLKIELKDLVDRLARGLEPTEYTHADEPMSIFVNPPPPINPKVDKAVVETIKTILKACKKHKIGCYGETMHLDESE